VNEITTILTEAATECLEGNRDKLWLAVKWRAKFEGWLKIELAEALRQRSFEPRLEIPYWQKERNSKKADISLVIPGRTFHLLLKTANTNWRMKQVENIGRPITLNYEAILDDINSLKTLLTDSQGIVLAVLFPTNATTGEDLQTKIERSAMGAKLLKEKPQINFADFRHGVRAGILVFGPYHGR